MTHGGSARRTKALKREARSKTRSEELAALAETIILLHDDDALDLVKKVLPSPSLLQTKQSAREVRERAVNILKASKGRPDARMKFVMLA